MARYATVWWLLVIQAQEGSHWAAPEISPPFGQSYDCIQTPSVVWPLTLLRVDPKYRLLLKGLVLGRRNGLSVCVGTSLFRQIRRLLI